MKTIFDKASRDELVIRIDSLNKNKAGLWGKMNVSQMAKHNIIWNEWF